MIRYALRCDERHDFESWFQSASAYDALAGAGRLSCPVCGSDKVSRALMAPALAARGGAAPAGEGGAEEVSAPTTAAPAAGGGSPPESTRPEVEKALRDLRRKVEENADYVGGEFARQARAMHLGDLPQRAIYGDTKPAEARSLLEDGVPVLPLPFRPRRKLS